MILEGKASDWSAKYTVAPLGPRDPVVGLPLHVPNTVTYTNAKTGTSVELRGEPGTGSPRQVAFVESTKQLEALLRSNPASSPTKILEASGFKLPTGEVKAYIDWQRVQVDSPLDRLVGQGWTADGINPYTDARIIENATAEVSARAATGNTGTAPWLKPGATVARVLPPGASYDGFGNVVRKYASGGYAVFEYAPHNVNANGAPVVSQQMFRGKVFHRTFSDGSEEWDTKGVPVSLLGPGAPAASTAAPVQRATVSAPRTTERELDQTIDSLFPSMNTQQKKEFKKMLMGLMKLLNRQSLADGQALAKLLKGELRS